MADLDVDRARSVGVAVPPASKDDYLEASTKLARGFTSTIDGTDPSIGWTVQSEDPYVDPYDTLPGQVYLPSQLPDPQIAIDNGMAPVKVPDYLITEDIDHIQGPEPSERVTFDYRDKLRAKVVDHLSGEDSAEDGGIGRKGRAAKKDNKPASTPAAT
jgi:hypothetical protein